MNADPYLILHHLHRRLGLKFWQTNQNKIKWLQEWPTNGYIQTTESLCLVDTETHTILYKMNFKAWK